MVPRAVEFTGNGHLEGSSTRDVYSREDTRPSIASVVQ
jgi:hypothetical protein